MFKIHSAPQTEAKSTIYKVWANGVEIIPEFARVSAMPFNTWWPGHQRDISQTEESPFISLESDEEIVFKVITPFEIQKASVSPLSKGIKTEVVSDNELIFTIANSGNYVLEINGIHNPLNIFLNPIRDFKAEAQKDAENGRKVYYFGKGVHNIGSLEIPSHSTVTIDAGAVVYGNISAFSAEDIKINGYGILDGSLEIRTGNTLLIPVMSNCNEDYHHFSDAQVDEIPYFCDNKAKFDEFMEKTSCLKGLLRFYFSKNITCEGVILRDSSTFCVVPALCENVVIENIKLIGMWRYNSDGIDIFNSKNIEVKNCFLRNFDDAMVIKGIAGWDFENNENITIDGCTIWSDWGAVCEIGAETNASEFKNITYKNCDLLYDAAGAMMRIHHHNRADVHNIRYENMHCEFHADQMNAVYQENEDMVYEYRKGEYQPYIICLLVNKENHYGRDNIQGCIHDISYKNIHLYYEDGMEKMPELFFCGVNEKCYVDDIKLENFYINGKKCESIDELNPIKEAFVYNIEYK